RPSPLAARAPARPASGATGVECSRPRPQPAWAKAARWQQPGLAECAACAPGRVRPAPARWQLADLAAGCRCLLTAAGVAWNDQTILPSQTLKPDGRSPYTTLRPAPRGPA